MSLKLNYIKLEQKEEKFSHAKIINEMCNPVQDMKKVNEYIDLHCSANRLLGAQAKWIGTNIWEAGSDFDIPLFSREHIYKIMRTAGSFRLENGTTAAFPKCALGDDCIGCKGVIPELKQAGALCAILTPQEYDVLITTGKHPSRIGMCILDERKSLAELFLVLSRQTVDLPDNIHTHVFQSYRCEFDTDGQYDSIDSIHPLINQTAAILFPIVQLSLYKLRCKFVPSTDVSEEYWQIDDSALSWHTPLSTSDSLCGKLLANEFPFGIKMSIN
jgi:hypothetical protein